MIYLELFYIIARLPSSLWQFWFSTVGSAMEGVRIRIQSDDRRGNEDVSGQKVYINVIYMHFTSRNMGIYQFINPRSNIDPKQWVFLMILNYIENPREAR